MINTSYVITDAYFDGERHFPDGPYTLSIQDGKIADITRGDLSEASAIRGIPIHKTPFLMPGLVEAHCHLFLDGGLLDFDVRTAYLNAPLEEMLAIARNNIAASLAAGITLVVDAGDRYGVNHLCRQESKKVTVRSAGLALRRPGRYGGFMAREVSTREEIACAIKEISKSADDLKVIQTGIIDFKSGTVKGEPQFDVPELRYIVQLARELGLRTLVHCSGSLGLESAVAAGVDSIEHGFFMTRDILKSMADKDIAWVPTFSPVYFQWRRPEIAGWDEQTVANLRCILDAHNEHVALADALGVDLIAGSDAGSHGVPHGESLIEELNFFLKIGLPMDAVLRSATSLPRKRWGAETARLEVGQMADFIVLEGSPFEDPRHLRTVVEIYWHGTALSDE